MKYRLFVICLLSIVSLRADSKNSDRAMIKGVAIYTSENSHYVIQTNHYFFRVEKSKLASETRAELDRAAESSQRRGFSIPHAAISHAWQASPQSESDSADKIAQTSTSAKDLRDHIIRNADQIEIAGTVEFSFQDSQYMMLSNGELYLILKTGLSTKENEHIAKLGIGEHADISLPANSLMFAGRLSTVVPATRIAKSAEPESVGLKGGRFTISGVVLHSFSDPLVIIRANQTYFQLKRSRVETEANAKLDLPGTHVKIRAPLEAVDFIWTIPKDQNASPLRAPASSTER